MLSCIKCSKTYPFNEVRYRCDCGALLEFTLPDKIKNPSKLLDVWRKRRLQWSGIYSSGVWRYRELLPDIPEKSIITKQEGNTRLHSSSLIANFAKLNNLIFKHEGENPTGSFKDRGMTCAISIAKMLGAKTVACASTGNTSASMAAYAACANMNSVIFIPEGKIAYGKLAQALAYGGKTLQIDGNFDTAMKLVQEVCSELNIYLLNSINPFRIEGQKAICFELLDQLNWQAPDWIVIPGGNLGNNSAISKALLELYKFGFIKKIPKIAVIQAQGANPLYKMWKNNSPYRPVQNPETIATAIKIGNPVSWEKSLQGIKWSNGTVEQVSEQEIMDAKAIIDASGIGAEPASCCSLAGAKKLRKKGLIKENDLVVGILTGNILKDPDSVIAYHTSSLKNIKPTFANKPIKIKADLKSVKRALENIC